jgi:hypothetical protein
MPPFDEALPGVRFFCSLPSFLRQPVTLEHARATLHRRLEWRESDFLSLMRRAVYQRAASPYRELLRLAGCEYGDIEKLVAADGVETALRTLLLNGVYLTVDEFKGYQQAVRGSAEVAIDPASLRNPQAAAHVPIRSSGSRGQGTAVPIDLAYVKTRAVNTRLALNARGGSGWRHANWGVPGSTTMVRILEYASFGSPPTRWFSQVDPSDSGLHPRYRWSARAMRWASLLARVPLPRPLYVSLEDPLLIARWMANVLRAGQTPHLLAFVSSAVRLCQAASSSGIDLQGAQFAVTGEPATEARLAAIRRTGATAVPSYASAEAGAIGYGCLAPRAPDDYHLYHDLVALIQPGSDGAGPNLPASALLFSSLQPTAPFILLNVSMGDQAEVARRPCGCPLERLGWTSHLQGLRSFEKLTAGGMTFFDTDVIRVLEEELPARFGGGPTDYQLLEEEADDGRPRLRLLVHPDVGPLDTAAIADSFLSAISTGSGVQRIAGLLWRDASLVSVERQAPRVAPSGKVLHLHVERRQALTSAATPT